MKVLVSTTANTGHFEPLVPIARACAESGHDVRVAAPAGFAWAVQKAGFDHMAFADASPAEAGAVFASLPGLDGASRADIDAGNAVVVREVFARLDAGAALPGLRDAIAAWRPDVVLRESAELGSYVAAEAAGVRHVQLNTSLSGFLDMPALVEDPLVGLGAEPGLAGLRSAPRLTLVPESLDGTASDGSAAPARFREEAGATALAALPDWWPRLDGPLVYVTFGTVAASLGLFPELYRRTVAALADLPVRVLMTTGDAGDPAAVGKLPHTVHVERFWPQRDVMPHATAMIAHGGLGTTLLALSHGVPMVLLPLFADQPFNADRVESLGAGLVVSGGPGATPVLPERLAALLADPSVRSRAGAVASEMARLPPVARAVGLLEDLASTTMGA